MSLRKFYYQTRHLTGPRAIHHTNKSLLHLVRLSLLAMIIGKGNSAIKAQTFSQRSAEVHQRFNTFLEDISEYPLMVDHFSL